MGIFSRLVRSLFSSSSPRRTESYRPAETVLVQPTKTRVTTNVLDAGPNRAVANVVIVERLRGQCYVVDGDTVTIGKINIRLAGIDAPEMDHPYGKQAKWALYQMTKGQIIRVEMADHLSFDRNVATCYLPDGRDISAEMVRLGLALDWHRFSGGKYRYLEPEGVRKKLWRVDAKHRGKMVQKIPN